VTAASSREPTIPPELDEFYSMLGSRAIWHEGWKAITTRPSLSGWGYFDEDVWELGGVVLDWRRPR
jgi:hypothetical protein